MKWATFRGKPVHKLRKAKSQREAEEYLNQINLIISKTAEHDPATVFGAIKHAEEGRELSPPDSVNLLAEEYRKLHNSYVSLKRTHDRLESDCVQKDRYIAGVDRLHAGELATERSKSERLLKEAKDGYNSDIAMLEQRMKEIEASSENRMALQKNQHDAQIASLKRSHKHREEQLKKDIQSRNRALVARDPFKPINDDEIKAEFSQLVVDVEEWARVEWEFNNSPWTEEVQRELSDAPKRLKKHILLDTIWGVLHDYIFCSPFRMLGQEGETLERHWSEAFPGGTYWTMCL
ncbi:hypothetical protein K491DRAFT_759285 [Lophiostoma macrostomum CBS 122681]|uniref:Uncharacterized protein n=1 Tax=Lophiostoma macrostomum CBS 122681 TaxID=1314788 RepID=A0A6A6T1Q3_9PLEO|nr:hypothetical protein K491DRAFT_759285 [Lophiostoma macrostomum CBS 122681]